MSEQNDTFNLRVTVYIERNPPRGYDRLSVDETVELGARSFMEVAAVLGRFHNLAERLKAEALGEDQAAAAVSRDDGDYTGSAQVTEGPAVSTSDSPLPEGYQLVRRADLIRILDSFDGLESGAYARLRKALS